MMDGIEQTRAAHIARECPVCLGSQTCYFRGQDVETLTREELLVAYRHACAQSELDRHWAMQTIEMDTLFTEVANLYAKNR